MAETANDDSRRDVLRSQGRGRRSRPSRSCSRRACARRSPTTAATSPSTASGRRRVPAHARRLLGLPELDGDAAPRHREPAQALLPGRAGSAAGLSRAQIASIARPRSATAGFSLLMTDRNRTRRSDHAIGRRGAAQLFLDARTHKAWLPREVPDSLLQRAGRPHEDGPDQRQLPAGPLRVREVEGGQGAAEAAPERGQRDKTMAAPVCAIIGYDLEFYEHLPKGQDPLSSVRGQAGADADDGVAQRLAAGRLSHPRGAGAWASIAGRCRASTMPASTRSSSPAPTSNRTSCATWAMAIRRRCARAVRASLSTRWRRYI